jgi:ATP:ADP antiporter, AAA family
VSIRAGEGRPVLAAALLFFVLLTSLMLLRPVREALGLSQGMENVRRLFLVTVLCTLPLVPLFGWLVSRCSARKLTGISFRICALMLVGFCVGLTLLPEHSRSLLASGYYVLHSVFNLFVISLFWAFMADHFSLAESKRLFPAITLGGSLGAIVGSLIAWQLVRHIGVNALFLLAALLLETAVWTASLFNRTRTVAQVAPADTSPIGGPWFAGIDAVGRSSYLRGVGLFVVLIGVVSTFMYFTGLRLVAAASSSTDQQAALFAHINLWTQLATLLAQGFLAGRIMRLAGVGGALAVLPVLAFGGFSVLAAVPTLAVFMLVNALFRAAQQGIAGPAQQTLFTVLERQDKYKAKSFLDTFGYRGGDAMGAYLERALAAVGSGIIPLAVAVLGLSGVWLMLCLFLGRTQARLATRDRPPHA